MAIAAEHLYDSCTCDAGMRDGKRCADCNGRGILPKGVKPTGKSIEEPIQVQAEEVDDAAADDADELENMSITHLRSRAKDLGVSAGGSKAALVARIKAAAADAPAPDSDDGESSDDGNDEDDEDDETT